MLEVPESMLREGVSRSPCAGSRRQPASSLPGGQPDPAKDAFDTSTPPSPARTLQPQVHARKPILNDHYISHPLAPLLHRAGLSRRCIFSVPVPAPNQPHADGESVVELHSVSPPSFLYQIGKASSVEKKFGRGIPVCEGQALRKQSPIGSFTIQAVPRDWRPPPRIILLLIHAAAV